MPDITCLDIDVLAGPCMGEHYNRLLDLMRAEHGYAEQRSPLGFSSYVWGICNQAGVGIDRAQCPERFAAAALEVLGQSVDQAAVAAQSEQVQMQLRFHLKR